MIFVLLTSIAAPTGTPFSLYESNATPNGNLTPVAGIGSLCVRNDAGNVGLYINTSTNVWVSVGGATGANYLDDVAATWGTTSPAQGQIVYVSASGRWELTTVDISAVAATQQTRPILIETGVRTTTDANAGQVSGALSILTGGTVQTGAANGGLSGAWTGGTGTATQSGAGVGAGSGAVTLASGATDSTVAGGTGGPSGAVTIGSGAATSTAGTSGATGITTVQSGASDDANTGAVNVQSGNAAGAGAVVSGTVTVRSGTVGGTGTTGNVALVSGAPVGAGISGNITGTTGNVAGAGTTGSIVFTTGNAAGAGTSGSIRLVVGTTAGGTAGSISLEAATISTTVQATQLQVLDNNAAALSIGAAGALNMLVFDTTNAAEELVVNAVNGIRAVNNVGYWIGTTATDRFRYAYDLGNNRGTIAGTAVTAAGGAAVTRAFRLETGAATVNNAAAGGNSGTIDFLTGLTDATAGGGTAGNTGAINFTTGPANQTAGTGGNSGGMAFATGNAAAVGAGVTSGGYVFTTGTVGGTGTTGGYTLSSGAPVGAGTSGGFSFTSGNAPGAGISGGATLQSGTTGTGTSGNVSLVTGAATGAGTSGNIVLTTGTAGGTRGVVDINAPTIDLVTQATFVDLIDNNAAALHFRAGAGGLTILTLDTTNGSEAVTVAAILTTNDAVAGSNARRVGGSILRTVAESAAVTGAEAVFAGGNVTIDNTPNVATKVGTRIAFSALVRVAAVSGAPTAQVRIRIGAAGVGGTLAFDTTARTVADEDIIKIDGYLDVRATGAPGTATGVCEYKIGAPDALASAAASEWGMDVAGSAAGTWTVAITTTGDVDVTITGQTDGAGTDLMLESFRVWLEA